jgi:hypothetical protein
LSKFTSFAQPQSQRLLLFLTTYVAWNIHGIPVDGNDLVTDGPASEEWKFRDHDHSLAVLSLVCHFLAFSPFLPFFASN